MICLRYLVLAGLGLLALVGPAWADSVGFDQLVIRNATGTVLFDSGPLPEGTELTNTDITVSAFSTDSRELRLGLLEPGTTNLSDLLEVLVTSPLGGNQTIRFLFFSDDETGLSLGPDVTTFETGSLQDVTSFFTNLTGSGLTVQVQSDVTPVPEPSTGILGLTALIGQGGALWRRSRRS